MADNTPDYCDIAAFEMVAKEYPDLYVILSSESCAPCVELKGKIDKAEIPTPMVQVPLDQCVNYLEHFQVDVLPTVVHLKKGVEFSRFKGAQESTIEALKGGK